MFAVYLTTYFSWVDRDMFMRYLGGGIGHQNQDARWTSTGQEDHYNDDMDIDSDPEENMHTEEGTANNQDMQLQKLHQLALETSVRPADSDDEDDNAADSDNSENMSSVEDHTFDDDSDDEVDEDEPYFGDEDGVGDDREDNGFGDF